LGLIAKVERDRAEALVLRGDRQKPTVEPNTGMAGNLARSKMAAVLADQHDAVMRIANQRADPRTIQRNGLNVKAVYCVICQRAGVHFIGDARITTKAHPARKPAQPQNGQKRRADLQHEKNTGNLR
jgi:hypothetical protein